MPSIRKCITEFAWEDLILVVYVLMDDAYRALVNEMLPSRERGREPEFSDSEVLTVTFVCEFFFGGDEKMTLAFLKHYHRRLFPHLLERTRYNRRRRALSGVIEGLRQHFTDLLGLTSDPHRAIDSFPITQCGWRRRHRCALMQGEVWQGHVAAKKQDFFGLRLHMTSNFFGVIDRWLLSPASLDERDVMPHLTTDDAPRLFLADSGYVSAQLEEFLHLDCAHQLLALRRANQRYQWLPDLRRIVKSLRRRIETAASVLADILHIEYPHAKTPSGLFTRIASKLFVYNFAFVLIPVLDFTFGY